MTFSSLYAEYGLCNCGHDYEDHMRANFDYVEIDEYCEDHKQEDHCGGHYEDQYVGDTEDVCHVCVDCPYFQRMTNLEYLLWLAKKIN